MLKSRKAFISGVLAKSLFLSDSFEMDFPPKFPIAKMEKSGYYECGFRLVNSIFGSRCHGTEMKVNGV